MFKILNIKALIMAGKNGAPDWFKLPSPQASVPTRDANGSVVSWKNISLPLDVFGQTDKNGKDYFKLKPRDKYDIVKLVAILNDLPEGSHITLRGSFDPEENAVAPINPQAEEQVES